MLRIHLTAEDLLRTRFASQPAPLIEVGHAIAALQRHDLALSRWRRSAAARLPAAARPLLDLIPASAAGPLFLDPVTSTLAEGLDLVRAAPPSFIAAELRRVTAEPSRQHRLLAAGDRQARQELERALRLAYRHLIAEDWQRVLAGFRAEVAWRSRLIAEQGIQAALSTLHPRITWNGMVMEIASRKEMDIRPGGRGLTLLPSLLWAGRPMFTGHPDGSTAVVYPAATPLPLVEDDAKEPLGGLLGHTRAAVLQLCAGERTTTELARELGISAATVSAHTKALRAAGLITTMRAGRAVMHSVTPLGSGLLRAAPPA